MVVVQFIALITNALVVDSVKKKKKTTKNTISGFIST